MFKHLACAAGAAGAVAASASGAHSGGLYLNPEYNGGVDADFEYQGGVLELGVGYEQDGFFIQGGPALATPSGESAFGGVTGKAGYGTDVTEKLNMYGEVSFAKFEDIDASFGVKAGAKFKF